MLKRSKYDKIFSFFESLYTQLADVPDDKALVLVEHWMRAKAQYAEWLSEPQSGLTKSKIAVGLEQGLREMPQILECISRRWKGVAINALQTAIENEYPEFLIQQREAVVAVMHRGFIRSESEFYLIRYQVECLERTSSDEVLMAKYNSLLEAYDAG